jgi:hypothetical protein
MNEPDFQMQAQSEFRFLVDNYEFSEANSEANKVRYTSKGVMVEVNYSARGEVDLIFDEDPPSYRFQFRLFLKAYHPEVEKNLGYGIANSDVEVRRELKRLGDALLRYGKPLLEHNRRVFVKMKTFKW